MIDLDPYQVFILIVGVPGMYFLYQYNLSVRRHIDENREMYRLLQEIHNKIMD